MYRTIKTTAGAAVIAAALSGCASVSMEKAFQKVSMDVHKRTGKKIAWNSGSGDDVKVEKAVQRLLSRPLTAQSAVQIALLHNRSLQATYTDLGVAQADLVQAGLLKNPLLDAAVSFPEGTNTPNLSFGLAFKFIELFWIPLRKEVAKSELERVKLEVSGAVIDYASTTHMAYIDYVAAAEQVALLKQVKRSFKASVATAKALRKAGNITALQYDQQKSSLTQVRLDLARAETTAAETREKLNVMMGVTGKDTNWRTPHRLPRIPHRRMNFANIEKKAIKASLNLAAVKQSLMTFAIQYRLTEVQTLVPDIETGGEFEREDGEKSRGPTLELEIPIFDTGEAKRAKARMEILRLRNRYWDLGIRIRSEARVLRARMLTERKTIRFYEKAVLPESARILKGTQKDYNAMQSGVFQLINAKRLQINAAQKYIEAQRSYWRAYIAFQQLLNGRLPENGGGAAMSLASAQTGGDTGGH